MIREKTNGVLPIPPPRRMDPNWLEKIRMAKQARELGKQLRQGKPVTFQAARIRSTSD